MILQGFRGVWGYRKGGEGDGNLMIWNEGIRDLYWDKGLIPELLIFVAIAVGIRRLLISDVESFYKSGVAPSQLVISTNNI